MSVTLAQRIQWEIERCESEYQRAIGYSDEAGRSPYSPFWEDVASHCADTANVLHSILSHHEEEMRFRRKSKRLAREYVLGKSTLPEYSDKLNALYDARKSHLV